MPSRAVPVLGGRGRLERTTRCGVWLRQIPSEARRSGKTGAAIPRGEFGLCDPRRPHVTTGASVRLTSVAQPHPYSPRRRAEREYELRRFSGPRKRPRTASAGAARSGQRRIDPTRQHRGRAPMNPPLAVKAGSRSDHPDPHEHPRGSDRHRTRSAGRAALGVPRLTPRRRIPAHPADGLRTRCPTCRRGPSENDW